MAETERRTIRQIGDEIRRERARAARLRRRVGMVGLLLIALGATMVVPIPPILLWNASPSVPVGLYLVTPRRWAAVGDLVVIRPAPPWRDLAAARGYLPTGVPLVKRAAAIAGSTVCAVDDVILVDGRLVAHRRRADARRRWMPWWRGCVDLRRGELFSLTGDRASFDGRYIGVTKADDIIGRARPLWVR